MYRTHFTFFISLLKRRKKMIFLFSNIQFVMIAIIEDIIVLISQYLQKQDYYYYRCYLTLDQFIYFTIENEVKTINILFKKMTSYMNSISCHLLFCTLTKCEKIGTLYNNMFCSVYSIQYI